MKYSRQGLNNNFQPPATTTTTRLPDACLQPPITPPSISKGTWLLILFVWVLRDREEIASKKRNRRSAKEEQDKLEVRGEVAAQ